MSLATRCSACGTVFRVVQDQLRVSEGWVRCGRCSEVFNALEGLFDLAGTSGPMPLAREAHAHERVEPTSAPVPLDIDAGSDIDDAATPTQADDALPGPLPFADSHADSHAALHADSQVDTLDDARGESGFGRSRPRSRFDDIGLVDSIVPEGVAAAAMSIDEGAPSFLVAAERTAQWQRPRVRRSLWLAASLLAMLLAAQTALHQRDSLAARWPVAAPVLSVLCEWTGCTVDAPHNLEALAVESSGLTRVEPAPLYRLQVTLRNRGAWPALTPAFDLTMTDLRGEVVARRVLRAGDFGAPAPRQIAGGAEYAVNAVLDLGDVRVAGYTIELFYP